MPLLAFECLRRRGRAMTLETLVFPVFSSQGEDGLGIMIKAEGILPLDIIVTGIALQQGPLLDAHFLAIAVVIRMTGIAVFFQASPLKCSRTFG